MREVRIHNPIGEARHPGAAAEHVCPMHPQIVRDALGASCS